MQIFMQKKNNCKNGLRSKAILIIFPIKFKVSDFKIVLRGQSTNLWETLSSTVQTFVYNSILLTGLEFNCTVRDFLCPLHWPLIDFDVIRNCVQKFVLIGYKLNSYWLINTVRSEFLDTLKTVQIPELPT